MKDLLKLFLKLGSIGFGGPIALIGFMEEECVRRRKWITIEQFQNIVAVSKLFPGPLATLIAIRIGREREGTKGGIAAGVALIFPAFLLILFMAKMIHLLDQISFLNSFWLGLTLAAIAVATQATIQLTQPLFKKRELKKSEIIPILVLISALTFSFPRLEALFIIGTGLLGFAFQFLKRNRAMELASVFIFLVLFWGCFRASLFTFGSGIAIIPVLRTVFVEEHRFVSNAEFLRGLTLGQVTPGPLTIVSTYLGFVTAGITGALVTTVATFLPTFLIGTWIMPRVEANMLASEKLRSFFNYLIPAVCAAIFGSLVRLMLFSVVVNEKILWDRIVLVVLLLSIMIRFRLSAGTVFVLGGVAAYFLSS